MSTSSIPPISPNYGIGKINSNSQRQSQGKSFEETLEKDASEEEADAADSRALAPARRLQPEAPVIRRDTQDGRHHIDVIA